jgi:hypothetical protein
MEFPDMQHRTHTNTRTATAARIIPPGILAILLAVAGVLGSGTVADGRAPATLALAGDDRSQAVDPDTVQLLIDDIIELTHPRAEGDDDDEDELELETLAFFIEFNETDEDVGVQCLLGGEPYTVLRAFDPDERRILDLRPRSILKQQGLSDFFFESAEPTLDEFSMAEFLDRFPVGIYEFETTTIDGEEQDGEAEFTHVIPAGPEITSPLEGDVVNLNDVVVSWEPVTMTTAFNPPQVPVTIVGYQVFVTREDPLRILRMDVSADTTSVSVPPEFLEPETEYEVEVLAIEASDNQTISIIFFETE